MSRRVAKTISLTVVAIALACIVTTIWAGTIPAREGVRTSIVVVPSERQADIDRAIEDGDGCPTPAADRTLADAADVYCFLSEQLDAGPFDRVTPADPFTVFAFIIGLLWIATGYVIVTRRGSNVPGWIFQAVGLAFLINVASLALVYVGVNASPGSLPLIGLWAALGEYSVLTVALLPLLWLLFPDGKPPTPRWRLWIRVYAGALALAMGTGALMPGPLNNFVDYGVIYLNPIGQPWIAGIGGALMAVGVLTVLSIAVASVFALRRRFKRSTGDERQQLRWLRFVLTLAVILFLLGFVVGNVLGLVLGDGVWFVGLWFDGLLVLLGLTLTLGIPGAYLIAIFRHGLWELDLVIRKTLIVAVVGITLTVLGVGILVVIPIATLGVGGSANADALVPVIVGVTLGLLFGPVRRRARRFADRVVYGARATPYEVLTSFGERLSGTYAADDVLPRTAQVLAQATGATSAAIWLRVGGSIRPEAVWPSDSPMPAVVEVSGDEVPPMGPGVDAVEVRHQGELLGALSVEMPANDPLDPARRQLLEDLATQAGLVLRNARLIEELRASRQRLVAAQDEERRKLERDIHDGVQQQLVALSVQLRLAEQLTDRDPAKVKGVLAGLQSQATDALEDLRDLARGIYPPLLADKGLAAALGAQARKAVVPTTVDADGLGRYPRDVEATVYFCTLEAMNNIAKYAEASAARISLAQRNGTLEFAVHDDGRGFDTSAIDAGTGLQGIEDRLDALGGRLTIESQPGHGTIVRGELPITG